MKNRIKLIWYWLTSNEIGIMWMRRELMKPIDFGELLRNIFTLKK